MRLNSADGAAISATTSQVEVVPMATRYKLDTPSAGAALVGAEVSDVVVVEDSALNQSLHGKEGDGAGRDRTGLQHEPTERSCSSSRV